MCTKTIQWIQTSNLSSKVCTNSSQSESIANILCWWVQSLRCGSASFNQLPSSRLIEGRTPRSEYQILSWGNSIQSGKFPYAHEEGILFKEIITSAYDKQNVQMPMKVVTCKVDPTFCNNGVVSMDKSPTWTRACTEWLILIVMKGNSRYHIYAWCICLIFINVEGTIFQWSSYVH